MAMVDFYAPSAAILDKLGLEYPSYPLVLIFSTIGIYTTYT